MTVNQHIGSQLIPQWLKHWHYMPEDLGSIPGSDLTFHHLLHFLCHDYKNIVLCVLVRLTESLSPFFSKRSKNNASDIGDLQMLPAIQRN